MGNWLINLSQIWASYGLKRNHRKSWDIGISMEAGSLWASLGKRFTTEEMESVKKNEGGSLWCLQE